MPTLRPTPYHHRVPSRIDAVIGSSAVWTADPVRSRPAPLDQPHGHELSGWPTISEARHVFNTLAPRTAARRGTDRSAETLACVANALRTSPALAFN